MVETNIENYHIILTLPYLKFFNIFSFKILLKINMIYK